MTLRSACGEPVSVASGLNTQRWGRVRGAHRAVTPVCHGVPGFIWKSSGALGISGALSGTGNGAAIYNCRA